MFKYLYFIISKIIFLLLFLMIEYVKRDAHLHIWNFILLFLSRCCKGLIYVESRKVKRYIPLNHSTVSSAIFFFSSFSSFFVFFIKHKEET